jgi:TolB-like protein
VKKIFLTVFFVIPCFIFAQNALPLDTALSNSTDYLNKRIPAQSKVVILNFTSNWAALSEYIIEELTGYIVNEGSLTVVDRRNMEAIRQEMDFQLSGEVSDETAQSIGQKLGAQTIISGSITAIGNTYRLRIRAIAVKTAQIQGMHNIDVVQDSRLAALTGTAYTAPSVTSSPPPPATQTNSSSAFIILPNATDWQSNTDGKSTVKFTTSREYIEGKARDILNIETNLARTNGWRFAGILLANNTIMQRLRNGSGVRLKVLGDGNSWRFYFATLETNTDYCHYMTTINTKRDKVVELDIPYSKLRQPEWGKRARFNKNSITYIIFERGSDTVSGESFIKIFDFEVY